MKNTILTQLMKNTKSLYTLTNREHHFHTNKCFLFLCYSELDSIKAAQVGWEDPLHSREDEESAVRPAQKIGESRTGKTLSQAGGEDFWEVRFELGTQEPLVCREIPGEFLG